MGQFVEMCRREHRRDGLALGAVFGLIHRDEVRAAKLRLGVADGDAAEACFRRIDVVAGFDLHDVVVRRHRPVGPEHAVAAIVDRVLAAQPFEIGPERIGAEQLRIADVEVLERGGVGLVAGGLDARGRAGAGSMPGLKREVHDVSPELPGEAGCRRCGCRWRLVEVAVAGRVLSAITAVRTGQGKPQRSSPADLAGVAFLGARDPFVLAPGAFIYHLGDCSYVRKTMTLGQILADSFKIFSLYARDWNLCS